MVFYTRFLPISLATIGFLALAFQTTILHPFHHTLDVEIHEIE
jgi:hypothetical protein